MILSNDPITWRDVGTVVLISLAALFYCMALAPKWERQGGDMYRLNTMCLASCETESCKRLASGRGRTYYFGQGPNQNEDNARLANCALTFFNGTHILMHFVIGFLFPKWQMFLLSLVGGVAFELYEKFHLGCEDPLDIVCNTGGFFLGALARRGFDKIRFL